MSEGNASTSRKTLALEIVAVAVAAVGLAVQFTAVIPPLSKLNDEVDSLRAQTESLNLTSGALRSSFNYGYLIVSADSTNFIDRSATESHSALPWASEVESPDFSEGRVRPHFPGEEESDNDVTAGRVLRTSSDVLDFVDSPDCSCDGLVSEVGRSSLVVDSTYYLYLALSQIGDTTASDVVLTLSRYDSGQLRYTIMTELNDRPQAQGEVELSLGPMAKGESRLIPLYTSSEIYRDNYDLENHLFAVNLGSAYLPEAVSFSQLGEDRRRTESVRDIRNPAQVSDGAAVGG